MYHHTDAPSNHRDRQRPIPADQRETSNERPRNAAPYTASGRKAANHGQQRSGGPPSPPPSDSGSDGGSFAGPSHSVPKQSGKDELLDKALKNALSERSLYPRIREAETVNLPRLPTANQFRTWKMTVQTEISAASGRCDEATAWLREVDLPAASFESLAASGPLFAQLDGKVSSAIRKRLPENDLGRRLQLAAEREFNAGRMMKGRQCLYIIYQYFQSCEAVNAYYNTRDLAAIVLRDSDLPQFLNQWEYPLLGMKVNTRGD